MGGGEGAAKVDHPGEDPGQIAQTVEVEQQRFHADPTLQSGMEQRRNNVEPEIVLCRQAPEGSQRLGEKDSPFLGFDLPANCRRLVKGIETGWEFNARFEH